MKTEAMLFEM